MDRRWPKRTGVQAVDKHFLNEVVDSDAGIWRLQVARSGAAILRRDSKIVAVMTPHLGRRILRRGGAPREVAAIMLGRLIASVTPPPEDGVRTTLESDLAAWIAENV